MKTLLTIDVGTSSTKVALFSQDGILLNSEQAVYAVHTPHSGWAEQDTEVWWEAVCQCASNQSHTGHGQGKGDHDKRQGKRRVIRQSKHKPPPGHHLHAQTHEVCEGAQP